MALLALKRAFLPSSDNRSASGYSFLPRRGSSDLESADALSVSSSSPFLYDEKAPSTPNARTLRARVVSDATIGLSDGLTVPFALTAGLSALGAPRLVVYGGLAELMAGSISMGLGGYLGARSEAEAYESTSRETRHMVKHAPGDAAALARNTLRPYCLDPDLLDSMSEHLLMSDPEVLVSFLMRFHHGIGVDDSTISRAYVSAATIAAGYFCGGFIPLLPYLVCETVGLAFRISACVMAIALFAFGAGKTRIVGEQRLHKCVIGGVQMMVMGGLAAAAAMGCVNLLAGD